MTRDDDFIGQLEGYLDEFEGVTPLPDEIRDAVRAQLPTTKQIGPIRGPMRYLTMNRPFQIAAAGLIVVAAAVAGYGLLSQADFGVTPSPTPSPPFSTQTPLPSPVMTPTPAPRPASWTQTGSMITARTNGIPHTEFIARLLLDGRVLVTGGYDSQALSDSELYDPRSGRWMATGNLTNPRSRHSVTVLPDGMVLVAGGGGDGSAEVYDPATGTWTATGSMHSPRSGHLAVALLDGRVLAIGGTEVPSAEVYDQSSGRWTTVAAPTGNVHTSDTATVLGNGDVLLVGLDFPVQLYHPSSGSWETTGQMIQPRSYHSATLLADGRVLVAAGWIGSPVINTAEIYDPRTRSWSATGSLLQNAEPNAAMLLSDGTVLVVQGYSGERYDPRTGQWRVAPEMPAVGQQGSAAVLLADGTVLFAGGDDLDFVSPTTSAYIYDLGLGN